MRSPINLCFFLAVIFWQCQRNSQTTELSSNYVLLDAQKHGLDFINRISQNDSINIINYLYAYNGGGVAAGDLNRDGLPELFFTSNQGDNKLYLNKGELQFTDITVQSGIKSTKGWYTGVNIIDVNGDGWLDIYLCQVGSHLHLNGRNELYINQGNLTFKESAQDYGLDFKGLATHAAFFDYDLDNDLDMYLLCHAVHSPDAYQDTTMRVKRSQESGDILYRNDDSIFADVSAKAGIYGSVLGYGLGVNIGDFNKDGWPDIYVSNDFHENDYLYLNNQDGTFRESSKALPCHSQFSMGNAIGDVDNNGWPDIFTLDMRPMNEYLRKTAPETDALDIFRFKLSYGFYYQFPRNMLQLNQGLDDQDQPWFKEVGQVYGLEATDWSWSVVLTDANLDGKKDVVVSNGIVRRPNDLDYLNYTYQEKQKTLSDRQLAALMPEGQAPNQIFIQQEELTFKQDSLGKANCVTGLIAVDLDGDGDEELVGNTINDQVWLMENNQHQYHYVTLDLRCPYGVDVEIVSGQSRQFFYSGPRWSFQSMVNTPLTIGLAENTVIDTIKLARGTELVAALTNIPADTLLRIDMPPAKLPDKMMGPVRSESRRITILGLSWQHQENKYQDEVAEPFIPYYLSETGPCLAIADMNGDGLEDIYLGSTQNQPGQLAQQTAQGIFKVITLPGQGPSLREETSAIWTDADRDGDVDMITAGGGSELGTPLDYTCRIYLNEKGQLRWCPTCLPKIPLNAAVIRCGDIDGDGDKDLFVGGKSKPGQYGSSPFSLIFINQGQGNFSIGDTTYIRPFGSLGMVTDAQFFNQDQDAEEELMVIGHWMPLTYFDFSDGKISSTSIPHSAGWWNCLFKNDVDGDGDDDFLLGNWGLNSPLRADTVSPLQLYIADFDQNGYAEPLLTYYQQHQEYPVLGKETLQKHLPMLKKLYPDFASFATITFPQLFPGGLPSRILKKKVSELRSGVLINQGERRYTFLPFQPALQVSPLYAITALNWQGKTMFILGGNNYSAQPYLGRVNNRVHTGLIFDRGSFRIEELPEIFLDGEVRALQPLVWQGRQILISGSINQPLALYDLGLN